MKPVLALAFAVLAGPAWAQPSVETDREQIRSVIDGWYAELRKREAGNVHRWTGSGFIQASPHYRHLDTGAAVLGPPIYTSLAARALEFRYEITGLRIDPNFARAQVWEKGFFYAFAAERTYELAASTRFILERDEASGRWLIAGHQTSSTGIPPAMKTDPLPDMRKLWERRQAKDKPQADSP